jgi:histidine triad (HIT) family protein
MTDSNLDLPEAEPCAFCDYLSGRRPYTVLCRSDIVAVLVTREQRGIGHLLVLPTRHYPTLLEATEAERHALIDTLAAAAKVIDEAYERPGIAIWQNNGTAAHQAIPHLHFHVAGTLPGGGTDFGEVPELSVEETDRIANKLNTVGGSKICV